MAKIFTPCPKCSTVNRVEVDGGARAVAPVCGRCKASLNVHGAVSEVDGAGLEALLEKTERPVVVDFWAAWCGPCKVFAPTFAETAAELVDRFTFVKLDTERDPAAANRYRVQAIPTLLLLQDGRERARRSGAMDRSSFEHWLRAASGAG